MDKIVEVPELMSGQAKIAFAHSLRAVAVVMVLVSHLLGTFWLHGGVLAQMMGFTLAPEMIGEAPAFIHALHHVRLLSWGAMGVALFFLISGFVIPFSLERHGIRGFIVGRLCRILPTYWAGSGLGCSVYG